MSPTVMEILAGNWTSRNGDAISQRVLQLDVVRLGSSQRAVSTGVEEVHGTYLKKNPLGMCVHLAAVLYSIYLTAWNANATC